MLELWMSICDGELDILLLNFKLSLLWSKNMTTATMEPREKMVEGGARVEKNFVTSST